MNELLPYEEQLAGKLADIPLPDENPAWDAMRKMLDDDDGIVPPPVNNGCRRWGLGALLLLVLVSVTWGVYKYAEKNSNNVAPENSLPVKQKPNGGKDSVLAVGSPHNKIDAAGIARSVESIGTSIKNNGDSNGSTVGLYKNEHVSSTPLIKFTVKGGNVATVTGGEKVAVKKGLFAVKTNASETDKDGGTLEKNKNTPIETRIVDSLTNVVVNSKAGKNVGKNGKDAGSGTPATELPNASSGISKTITDSIGLVKQKSLPLKKIDSSGLKNNPSNKTKNTTASTQQIWFSAGLGLQQLIPVDGQQSSPYNAFGRKGSLADYIPSVYFRAHKNKSFLQLEFKYGAPQYTKDIAYSTKVISVDTLSHITTSAVNHVKKTYYHQLPVSVHYEVLPGLSMGAGVQWNKFQSAVVNQQTHQVNTQTGIDSIVSNNITSVKSDSAFAKTYWQFMLEAQYAWKRLSLGARYSAGLQPYITYTSPTGQTQRERNASLNVFIRYEL